MINAFRSHGTITKPFKVVFDLKKVNEIHNYKNKERDVAVLNNGNVSFSAE